MDNIINLIGEPKAESEKSTILSLISDESRAEVKPYTPKPIWKVLKDARPMFPQWLTDAARKAGRTELLGISIVD